ncbi:MAG: branched-chain amino acid transaminase [Anaerolineales bacterium]
MELPTYAYFEGEIVPYGEAKVSILVHALNYGTAAFGGLRGYWNEEDEQLYLFRAEDHFQRLMNSAKLLTMEFDESPADLIQITKKLLQKEGYHQDVYIRPLVYKAEEGIGVRLHDLKTELAISALPFARYVANDTDAHVTISSWRRIDDNMIPARGKITGAYANSAFIKSDAERSGFDEALVLTSDGHISEGSAENVFMVRDGVLLTPPVTENILEGITRRSVLQIGDEVLGIETQERRVDRTEIYLCDELFLTGTAAQITAVTQVDHKLIGSGKMGPITKRLRETFDDVVRGWVQDYSYWLTPVY